MNIVLKAVGKKYGEREVARRIVCSRGDEVIRTAKKVIFALHRDDFAQSATLLKEIDSQLKTCASALKSFPDLANEGPFVAGLEEFAEAQLFLHYIKTGKLGAIDKRTMSASTYLGGLCDTTGEIVRYAMRQATHGNHTAVTQAFDTVESVITDLLDFDLTGYLRTKFDQAKRNLRQLEQMQYELSHRIINSK